MSRAPAGSAFEAEQAEAARQAADAQTRTVNEVAKQLDLFNDQSTDNVMALPEKGKTANAE